MKDFNTISTRALLFVALFFFTSASHAALIKIYTQSFYNSNVAATAGPTSANFVQAANSNSTSTYLNGFDSTLGTLISANITFNTTTYLYGSISVRDPFCWGCEDDEDDVRGSGAVHSLYMIDLLNPNMGGAPTYNLTDNLYCDGNDRICTDYANIVDYDFVGTLLNTSNEADLSLLVDTTLQIDATQWGRADVVNCGDDEDLCKTTVGSYFEGSYMVEYHYNAPTLATAVPEPTTLAIFTLGMIGLASRRFKKQS
jgi:hypothetical protein